MDQNNNNNFNKIKYEIEWNTQQYQQTTLRIAESNVGRSISLGSNPGMPLRQNATTTPGLRYKNLGKSGLRVSNVGLGTWPIFTPSVSEEQAEAIVRLAVESGINLFDLSEAHSGGFCEKKQFGGICKS
jgi:potassium voltage-gated channel Shaker-related subfamily A, beta member 2